MLPVIKLPNGRSTTALAFGLASLLRLPDQTDRQRLLDQAVDLGIRHFDVARLYGLGYAEAELGALLRRHSGQLTVATKFGLGDPNPPSATVQRQGLFRRLLQKAPFLKPLARHLHGRHFVPRDFSVQNCRKSLSTSMQQLGIETVDLLLLHEPQPIDLIERGLEDCLADFQKQGLIGGYGLSAELQHTLHFIHQRPSLVPHLVQWHDSGLTPEPNLVQTSVSSQRLYGRFGRIRISLPIIQQAFNDVPQLLQYWNERLSVDLTETHALVAALLCSSLSAHPESFLIFSTTNCDHLRRTLQYMHSPPWTIEDLIAFDHFWRRKPAQSNFALCR